MITSWRLAQLPLFRFSQSYPYLILIWYVSGEPEEGKLIFGESQGLVKLITEFLEATEMVGGIGSEIWWAVFGAGNIINGQVRRIKIWDTTIK